MKRLENNLLSMLILIPSIVFASSNENIFPIEMALAIEAFTSIFMSVFVFKPLSKIISKENNKKFFWILFGIRITFLLLCDFLVTTRIAIVDFKIAFIGTFLMIIINAIINKKSNITPKTELKCAKCGANLQITDKFCTACGTKRNTTNNNVNVQQTQQQVKQDTSPIVQFDTTYYVNEKVILKNMLKEEVKNQGENISLLSTRSLNTKKNIALVVLGVITLINALLYFFNYSMVISLFVEIIGLIIYIIVSKKFNILNVLTKRAIENPYEELSKIVNDVRNQKRDVFLPQIVKVILVLFFAIFIPSITFFRPKLIYTRYGDGYQVFKYTKGIIQSDNEVIIASTYKGKNVIAIGESAFQNTKVSNVNIPYGIESIKTKAFYNASNIQNLKIPASVIEIRGEAFAYMSSLTNISLPEGLKEIRGGAFAYDYNLKNVILPSTLEYLGGSAFSHCSSITEMTIPNGVTEINGQTFEYMTSLQTINLHDKITYIHGEVFIGDTSLNNIKLPPKITEIKGSTFEGCSSFTSIEIPEGVTRIGGHAFYGCTSLSYVFVPRTITEIGSSAFRQCYSLKNITIPRKAVVNERAFKESPTRISYYNY